MTGLPGGATFRFKAPVWEHEGPGSWWFIGLPEDVTDEIDELFGHLARGFGSLRVEVTVGRSVWRTSVFPDTKRGTFLLPVKKAIRTKEHLDEGTVTDVELTVRTD